MEAYFNNMCNQHQVFLPLVTGPNLKYWGSVSSNINKKRSLFTKIRALKISPSPVQTFLLKLLQQNKFLLRFRERGQDPKARCTFYLDQGIGNVRRNTCFGRNGFNEKTISFLQPFKFSYYLFLILSYATSILLNITGL